MNISPPITLRPDQVGSRNMLEAHIGTPPGRLLIFTGIAVPDFQSNGQLDGVEVTVDLNARSNVPNPPFTATVGLATIYNDDTDLLFATDDVKVITGNNLELLLVCNIAVLGDPSSLHRFSYQAMVMLPPDNGVIAGTIRWNPHFLTFALDERDLFQISAFSMQPVPGVVPQPGTFPRTALQLEKVGTTIGTVVRKGSTMELPYEIRDLRMGEPIVLVSVVAKPGAFVLTNSPVPFEFVRTSGPGVITLDTGHLVEKPVDFEARQVTSGPH